MYRLAYVSTADEDITSSDLQDILESAIRHNTSHDVTGTLLFNGASFLQVLEGPEEKVAKTYERICVDTRHRHVVTIFRESGTRRSFGNMPMSLNTVKSRIGVLPDGLILSDLELALPSGLPDYLRVMLSSFNTMQA